MAVGRHVPGGLRSASLLVSALLALGACREAEQDRFRLYQPGLYQGQPDQALDEKQRRALADRIGLQAAGGIGASPIDKAGGDVRPPR